MQAIAVVGVTVAGIRIAVLWIVLNPSLVTSARSPFYRRGQRDARGRR